MAIASSGGLAYVTTAGGVGNGAAISISGNTSGTPALVSSGTLVLAGGNNVTLSQNGQSITISANTAAAANLSVSAGSTSGAFGGLTFANSNGASFGLNNGTITASINSTSAAGLGTSVSGNLSITMGTAGLQINASNLGATGFATTTVAGTAIAGTNNTTGFTLAVPPYITTQTVQTQASGAIAGTGFTSTTTTGTVIVGTLNTAGLSVGVPAYVTTSGAGFSGGVSTGGNTSGNTGTQSGQFVLAGGNNITLSVSTAAGGAQTITISGANAGGAQTGISGIQVSNTTYTSGTVTLQNANGISFGSSGANGISASYTVPAAQTGISGVQVSNTTYTSGTITLQNANGISFGSSGANGISASYTVPTQSNQTVGLYALGNTTQNSSTTLDARTLSFNALGAMTWGYSNGSIQVSAPATSSISGTGAVSVAVNGSTISIGAPNYGTQSYWDNGIIQGIALGTQIGIGSVVIQPVRMDANLSMSALREFISGSFSSSSNSSYALTLSVQAALYTLNGSTLSLASSGSQSYAVTNTSNNSTSALSGIKGLTIPLNASLTPGNYWLGLWSSSASANANWATISNVVQSNSVGSLSGLFGAASAASNQYVLGGGLFSTTSSALPTSIGLSQITGSAGNTAPFVNLYNVSA